MKITVIKIPFIVLYPTEAKIFTYLVKKAQTYSVLNLTKKEVYEDLGIHYRTLDKYLKTLKKKKLLSF